ncbi:unnamed protein product [Zymoseptoria tritici ST99CH_3D7]|uniref:Uncharacterized protein n=1 Tax=Zymoseptoria tritici (strain ST99CH_3D7) TaxID=1276538 RepID=A0A1X7RXJ6_ZYMT9|nr:unnamed protein product [Zymoseptoria tritici ST99CH_3D7]
MHRPDPSSTATLRKRNASQLKLRKAWTPPASESLMLADPVYKRTKQRGVQVLGYFHKRTVPTIGQFVASYVAETLPQMSGSVPAIKHCILAVGSDQSGQALRKAEEVLQTSTTACRRLPFSPSLRRKAVDLPDACPRIEGLWNAREAAAVARFVIALEEHVEVEEPGETIF